MVPNIRTYLSYGAALRLAVYMRDIRPGIPASIALHLAVLLLFVHFMRDTFPPSTQLHAIPVDLVLLDRTTQSPPEPLKSAVPRQKAPPAIARGPYNPQSPGREREAPTKPPLDELQAKLESLSKAVLPADPRLDALADENATSGNAKRGARATYSVRDFVRAQIERRWNLDLTELGGRNIAIPIHVVLARDGTVKKAEIVNTARFAADPEYYSLALSARNAALLSSPVKLPPGTVTTALDMVLDLNPKDVVR